MKKIILFITLLLIITSINMVYAEDGAQLEIINNNKKDVYNEGDTFEIEVRISDVKDGAELLGTAINFDDNCLKVKDITREQANDFAIGIDPKNQIVMYYASSGNNKKLKDGILGTILFEVKEGASNGITKLNFAKVLLSDYDNINKYSSKTNEIDINIKSENIIANISGEKNIEEEITENESREIAINDPNDEQNEIEIFNNTENNNELSQITKEKTNNSTFVITLVIGITMLIILVFFFFKKRKKENDRK